MVPIAESWSQIPSAPSAGPATLGSRREMTYASTRLNVTWSPIPRAIGAPKRNISAGIGPPWIRPRDESAAVIGPYGAWGLGLAKRARQDRGPLAAPS